MHIKLLLSTVLFGLTTTLCSAAVIDYDALAAARRLKPVIGNVTTPDGTILSYRLFNDTQTVAAVNATPVILVGGLGQVQTDWDAVIPHFTKNHPVLSFDNRGIGLSTVTNTSLVTRQKMADDIRELTQHFGWKQINLVGFSMGSIVSETFAASNFTNVKIEHLVLIGGAYKNSTTSELIEDVGQWLQEFSIIPPPSSEWTTFIHKLMLVCLTPTFISQNPSKVKTYLTQLDAGVGRTYDGFMSQVSALGVYDLTEDLKHFTVPTLILHGALDAGMPVTNGREMHELIPRSEYIEYGDGGHVLTETNPESIQAIVQFFDGVNQQR
ncbi:hypothetical protein BGX29_000338 [Mortierella sp. GBA35]|nr:hypothetical protein BGX29_000338 [Mortierella sp. GBA35]